MTHEERKLATVLFADLVGSTELADGQDPERIRLALSRFYDAMSEEVERYGGTVEKFIGDAVMAAFGAPAALEDHAERALHAALAMRQRLADLFGERLAIRIGIYTGDVMVGRPREGSSFVAGDVVNSAARLEQAAGPGEILAGERTAASARGAFEFGEPLTIEAKGKPGGIIGRPVLRALAHVRPRGVRELAPAFLGRVSELEELKSGYRRAVDEGVPRMVCVLGEAGVGKSRLIREFWTSLGEVSPAPTRRSGRALSYGQGTTYWPLGDVLKEHFAINDGDSPHAIAAKLADHPYLGMTLGLAGDQDVHPLVARERLHDAWVRLLAQLVVDGPVVLLLEDLHWADADLCDLVDTIVDQLNGPLLVLVTARLDVLDRHPNWGGSRRRTSSLRLEPLPDTETGSLLRALVGIEIPAPILDVVVARAEGNPFFVEEIVATFMDRGVLQRRNGSWSFSELPADFTIPDTVQAVLASRIDGLREDDRAALQAAAVIGRVFWTGPTYELLAGASPDIGLLEEHAFIRRHPVSSLPGEREYAFKHALTRDVAYGTLPKARRAYLHATFAGWLERRADGRDELTPLLAHHYAQAVVPEDVDLAWAGQDAEAARLRANAVAWARRAAGLAIGRYEIDDALALLRQAVALEPDALERASLWYEIGHASALKYDGAGMVAAMERAIELGAPAAQVYPELAAQTVNRAGMWQRRLDPALVDGWIARALAAAPEGSRARVRALFARAAWNQDMADANAAVSAADELGEVDVRSEALGAKQAALETAGRFAEAWEVAESRDGLLPEVADPDHRAEALLVQASLAINIGRLAPARTLTERLEATVAGLTPHHRVHGLMARALLESAVADWETVRSLTPQVESAIEKNLETPCPANVGLPLWCAIAMASLGDEEEAARLVAKAESVGMVGYARTHAAKRLRLAIARRDQEEVRRQVDSIEDDWLKPDMFEFWAALFDGLALLGDRGRIETEAPAWIRPDAYVAPFAVKALGVTRGDPALLRDAVTRFDEMGLARHANETRAILDGSRFSGQHGTV